MTGDRGVVSYSFWSSTAPNEHILWNNASLARSSPKHATLRGILVREHLGIALLNYFSSICVTLGSSVCLRVRLNRRQRESGGAKSGGVSLLSIFHIDLKRVGGGGD